MGPHATLAESTVRENIMTGKHFWGCKCCGVYDRHNEVVQTTMAFFKYELKFSGSTGSGQQLRRLLREGHGKAHGWAGLGEPLH